MREDLLDVRNVHKGFGGVIALRGASLTVRRGEFHALLGENGAGKSTLIKIVGGVYRADAGEIRWRGRAVQFSSPVVARQAGIGVVHQESVLIPHLSVLDNFILGREAVRGPAAWVDRDHGEAELRRHAQRLGVSVESRTPVALLPLAVRKRIEILRLLASDTELLILDEPTAALDVEEAGSLLELLRSLKAEGRTMIYVTHRLKEVNGLVDRVTVLKDGQTAGVLEGSEATPERVITLMVGRQLGVLFPPPGGRPGRALLRLEHFKRTGQFDNVSLEVGEREIVGLVGLQGHGHVEIARAIFGAPPAEAGRISVGGRGVRVRSPADALRRGIGLITEDRAREGVLRVRPVRENLTLALLAGRFGWMMALRRHAERSLAVRLSQQLRIRTPSVEQPVGALSGGNQQKVIVGRWLAAGVSVLVLINPTAGVDVEARAEIYHLLREFVGEGKGALVATSDLGEALGLCDRLYVLYRGRVVAHFARDQFDEPRVLAHMTGWQGGGADDH